MKPNVGRVDALMRVTIGLTGLAWGTARMIKRPDDGISMMVTLASAMKVAEGITRFCPMTAMLNANYGQMVEQAKEKLPIQRFTRTVGRQVENLQENAEDTVRNVARNMDGFDVDDFEPHH